MSLLRDDPYSMPCLHCLEPDTCSIRFDRKSRPFTWCISCGARTFLRGRASMVGLAMLGDIVRDLNERVRTDPAWAARLQTTTAAFFTGLEKRFSAGATNAPDGQTEPLVRARTA